MTDPISLTVAISALILGVWSHIRHSRCGCCEIDMQSTNTIQVEVEPKKRSNYPPNAVITRLESKAIPIPPKPPTHKRENYL